MIRDALARFLGIIGLILSLAVAADEGAGGAAGLRAKHDEYREKLAHNGFGKPIHLMSSESDGKLAGDVYAVVEHPFQAVSAGFREPRGWCDVLILPFNTKHCHASRTEGDPRLAVRIGRRSSQPAEDAYPIDFKFHVDSQSADYLRVVLDSDKGPLGTRNYRIVLEATPLDAQHSFLHLSYSYGFGGMSQMMMQAYLSTVGRSKIGFTVTGKDDQGKPSYVGGMRGATERNTMRYYLAIEAYLASLAVPPEQRLQKRLADWHAGVSRYPAQLHEMDRAEYFAMKQKEAARLDQPLG